jgi:hypothetical protein
LALRYHRKPAQCDLRAQQHSACAVGLLQKTPVPFFILLASDYAGFHDVQVDEGFDAICVHRDGVFGVVECELDLFSL